MKSTGQQTIVRNGQANENILRTVDRKLSLILKGHNDPDGLCWYTKITGFDGQADAVYMSLVTGRRENWDWKSMNTGAGSTNEKVLTWVEQARKIPGSDCILVLNDNERAWRGWDKYALQEATKLENLLVVIFRNAEQLVGEVNTFRRSVEARFKNTAYDAVGAA